MFVSFCIPSDLRNAHCVQHSGNGSLELFFHRPLLNIGCIRIGNAFVLVEHLSHVPPTQYWSKIFTGKAFVLPEYLSATLKKCHQPIYHVVHNSSQEISAPHFYQTLVL